MYVKITMQILINMYPSRLCVSSLKFCFISYLIPMSHSSSEDNRVLGKSNFQKITKIEIKRHMQSSCETTLEHWSSFWFRNRKLITYSRQFEMDDNYSGNKKELTRNKLKIVLSSWNKRSVINRLYRIIVHTIQNCTLYQRFSFCRTSHVTLARLWTFLKFLISIDILK